MKPEQNRENEIKNINENKDENIRYSSPKVKVKTRGYFIGFFFSVMVAFLLVILALVILYVFDLTNLQKTLFIGCLILIYLIISPILIQTEKIKEIKILGVRTIEKPVEKKVIVNRNVYVEKKRKKLNIPRFDYVGSTETKTYHKRTCKFAKLMKNKYKEHSNNISFFTKKKYKKCKVCLKK